MGAWNTSKGGKDIGSAFDKTLCRKNSCLQKGKIKCRYCGLSYCEEHRAPLPDKYRNSFGNKGHNCDNFPVNRNIKDIIKEYPYLLEEDTTIIKLPKPPISYKPTIPKPIPKKPTIIPKPNKSKPPKPPIPPKRKLPRAKAAWRLVIN